MNAETVPLLVVIEDNPSDVQLLEYTLKDAGLRCDVEVIVDGQKALAWVRKHIVGEPLPALVIVDLNLPKHDGIEILEEMQRGGMLDGTTVLVLSSSPSPRDSARVRAFPNTRYMTKPSDLDGYGDLAKVLEEMMRTGRTAPPK